MATWGNNAQYPLRSDRPNWIRASAYITIGATGAPTIASGPPGVSITRTSAGLYALAFPIAVLVIPSYVIVKSATLTGIRGTAISQTAGTASFTTLQGVAVDMTDSSGGTADTTTPYVLVGAAGAAPDAAEFENNMATLAGVLEKMPLLDAATDPASGDILAVHFDVQVGQ